MPDDDKKWKPQEWGKAKAAFNEANQPKSPAKAVEAGRDSEMVRKSKPPSAPKPPGFAGQVMAQQAYNRDLAKEMQAAPTLKPKPARSLEDQQAIDRLNAKFRQAAAKEREQDRGR
jgi:hypothetical protein